MCINKINYFFFPLNLLLNFCNHQLNYLKYSINRFIKNFSGIPSLNNETIYLRLLIFITTEFKVLFNINTRVNLSSHLGKSRILVPRPHYFRHQISDPEIPPRKLFLNVVQQEQFQK